MIIQRKPNNQPQISVSLIALNPFTAERLLALYLHYHSVLAEKQVVTSLTAKVHAPWITFSTT